MSREIEKGERIVRFVFGVVAGAVLGAYLDVELLELTNGWWVLLTMIGLSGVCGYLAMTIGDDFGEWRGKWLKWL
jgi:phage shock protein PspC (stress-responsive transcriptional regulator)